MKIGTRVKTPHGIGTIKNITPYNTFNRYGVKHDAVPKKIVLSGFKNSVVYYFEKELKKL